MLFDEMILRDMKWDYIALPAIASFGYPLGYDPCRRHWRLVNRQHICPEGSLVEKTKLNVGGMSCSHCEIAVQDAVRKLPGIKKVKASRRKKEVSVDYDASLVALESIINAINSTGYRILP